MQKLTYTNIMGESLVFYRDPPFIFGTIRGTGHAGLVVNTLQGVYQNGDSTVSLRRQHREVDLTFSIAAADLDALYTYRRQLCGILAAWKAFDGSRRAKIIYENDSGRWWTWAIPEVGPTFENRIASYHLDIPVTFRCESPYWYAIAKSDVLLAYSGAGFSFPFSFPIAFGSRDFSRTAENAGHVPAPVEVVIEGHGETPLLTNADTGAQLRLTSALPAGHMLTINTDPAQLAATVTDADGSDESAFGLLAIDSPLTAFTLRPGLNRLVYEPGSSAALSRITVSWYAQYEGV